MISNMEVISTAPSYVLVWFWILCDEHRRTANSVDPVWYNHQADATTQLQSFRSNVRRFLLGRGGQITILLRFLEKVQ